MIDGYCNVQPFHYLILFWQRRSNHVIKQNLNIVYAMHGHSNTAVKRRVIKE
jgi:hypothetical protein